MSRSQELSPPSRRLRRAAVATAVVSLAWASLAPMGWAKALLGEPEIDRASDQYDGLWCPAEQILSFNGTFTADGPEATLVFVATNHSEINGSWRRERIDDVFVVPLATYQTYRHFPDSALAEDYNCIQPDRTYFHFNEVPPAQFLFQEKFATGPGPGWDMTDGAYENPNSSALNALALPLDSTGESLGLGLDEVPTTVATTSITFSGLAAGSQYVVSAWTQCMDASVGNDPVIQIYGTEFFGFANVQPIDTGPGRGCAWGDYDLDGDLDLFVTNYNVLSKLWRNNGGGAFQNVTAASGTSLNTLATAVSWADVDNDNDLDLYVASYGQNRYFRNKGNGTFVDATAAPLGDTRQSECVDWGDYDRDGDLDCFVANIENDGLMRNDGATFVDVASGTLLGSGRAVACSWVDYDDDGDLDLFVTYNSQVNELFVNGPGGFVKSTPIALALAGASSTAAWADYDNDGDLDAYITTRGSGNRLCRNDGGGSFAFATPTGLMDSGLGVESIWGDWNNDGLLDLYLIKNGQPNRLFRNDGNGQFGTQATGTVENVAQATGTAWGDYDGDGDLDVHVVNVGADVLYRNEFGDNFHWLHVNLKGVISNRFGVGAKVFVTVSGKTQMREVGGESGFRSQNSLTAEFGLGAATAADLIRVEWPSGIVQTLGGTAANQKILIVEHAPTGAEVADTELAATATVELHGGAPNPFRETSTISYSLPQRTDAELRVLDVSGRVVRVLDVGMKEAGEHRIDWNGRDRQEQVVAPGIYFLELRAGDARVTKKVVRVDGR